MYIDGNRKKGTKFSDLIILSLVLLSIISIVVSSFYPESIIAKSSSYVIVCFELLVSAYIIFYSNGILKINIEGFVACIYIVSSFFFTMVNAGYVDAVIAVFKEYVVIFVCIFLNRGTYSMKRFNFILKIIVSFAILSIVFSIVEDNFIGKIVNLTNVYEADIKSFFSSKNQFGRFLYLSTICTFFLSTYYTKKSKKRKYVALTGILTLATVLTFSRTSLLAIGMFFCTYYLITSKRNKLKKIMIIFTGLIIFYIIISIPVISDYISHFIIRKEVGMGSRTDIWAIGLDYISKHPLIGSGEFMAEKIINSGGINISEFHNVYIYRMVVSGIPIAMLFILILIKRFSVIKYNFENNPIMSCSKAMFISLLVYMFLEQYTIFNFSITGIIVIMFLYVAPNIVDFNKKE